MADVLPIHRIAGWVQRFRQSCTECHKSARRPGDRFCSEECAVTAADTQTY